jgi:hypothetical protein
VSRYGTTTTVHTATITCLWYSVFGSRPVRVVLLREPGHSGYHLALGVHRHHRQPRADRRRYAARWSIEVAIESKTPNNS